MLVERLTRTIFIFCQRFVQFQNLSTSLGKTNFLTENCLSSWIESAELDLDLEVDEKKQALQEHASSVP